MAFTKISDIIPYLKWIAHGLQPRSYSVSSALKFFPEPFTGFFWFHPDIIMRISGSKNGGTVPYQI